MWIKPSEENLAQEYHVEVVLKGHRFVSSKEQFIEIASKAQVMLIDDQIDRTIAYRSHTKSQNQLLSLIKGYRSYPEFRNEKTLQNLYDRIGNDKDMTMPLIIRRKDGSMRILAGNTRADVAMQLKGEYQALILDVV